MLYRFFERYDEDGGFGDAVSCERELFVAECTEEEAKAYVEKWDRPYIYDRPYANLYCCNLCYEEVPFRKGLSLLDPPHERWGADPWGRMH